MQNNDIALKALLEEDKVRERLQKKFSGNGTLHKDSLLKLRTANQRLEDAKLLPDMKQLFGTYWLTSEVTILAGDSGKGKTLLGISIADAISSGKKECLNQKVEVPDNGVKVLYIDLELGDKNFEVRYKGYEFSDNLIIANVNNDYYGDEKLCINSIREQILRSDCKIIIIDNISFLSEKSTADADTALGIINSIKEIARKHDLSILILAHVPKGKTGKRLETDDIAGSKILTNGADSAFFIAESKVVNQRYLKQTKVRNCEMKTKCDLIEIISEPYVHFEHLGEYYESELLPVFENPTDRIDIDWDNIFEEKDELRTAEIVEIAMDEYGCGKRSVEEQIRNAVGSKLEKAKRGVYRINKEEKLPQLPQLPQATAELRNCGKDNDAIEKANITISKDDLDAVDDKQLLEYAAKRFTGESQ